MNETFYSPSHVSGNALSVTLPFRAFCVIQAMFAYAVSSQPSLLSLADSFGIETSEVCSFYYPRRIHSSRVTIVVFHNNPNKVHIIRVQVIA